MTDGLGSKRAHRVKVESAGHEVACAPPTRAAEAVAIGDRVHFSPPQGGGPWHGIVIAHTAGAYTIEVVKPNGNHYVIVAGIGSEPGEFLLVT